MFDLNDAAPQMGPVGELIPDGTFAKLKMTIRPGGVNGAVPLDAGLLKASGSSDAKMLDCEFVVLEGPYARRKFWRHFVVDGGKRNDKGVSTGWNISKSTFRAMIESAFGINPKDTSAEAAQKRQLPALKYLDGIVFAARVMVEPATSAEYKDKNDLANVVLPTDAEYMAIMNGQQVDPDPVGAKPRKAASAPAATQQAPNWQTGTQAAPQQSAPPQQPPAGNQPAWLNG